jgi:uncharacterized protein (DUF362 family)/Pyruvate/2-oxoacid:ferredoxin oxidoreductase delta subunit
MNRTNSLSLADPFPQIATRNTALVRCSSYNPLEVRQALRRGIDLLGSLEQTIRPGDTVLLKPNLLTAKEPERAITTHPEIISAVGEMVLDCRGKIILGDSPGGQARDLPKYWDKTGMTGAAARLGIKPVSFEDAGIVSFPMPEGFVGISRIALEADVIINLPKLKTHQLTRLTGAVKNMFGTVPGFRKGEIHARAPQPLHFAQFLIAIYQQVIPALTIMDAIIAMEGNGPSSGHPRPLGALLFSQDALALDSLAAKLVGMEETRLPVFQAAEQVGLWDFNHNGLPVLGEDPLELAVTDFKMPDVHRLDRIPPFLLRSLKKLIWVRPKADPALCTSCARCVQNCPEDAMWFKKGIPQIDYHACIKCGCCDEFCPERAIYQEMSRLAKFFA